MEIGLTFTSTIVVNNQNLAKNVGSGDLEVFSSPSMAALMENAAMNAVANHLPDGATTVGVSLNISHNRPSGLGERIEATATLEEFDGRKLKFHVTAKDSRGIIGEGKHVRYIVDVNRFMAKLK